MMLEQDTTGLISQANRNLNPPKRMASETTNPKPEASPPGSTPDRSTEHDESSTPKTREIGGPKGLEPTRYGDWERKGRCVDF